MSMPEGSSLQERLIARRTVRAWRRWRQGGTAPAWAGSVPTWLIVERGLGAPQVSSEDGVRLWRLPYSALEGSRDWAALRALGLPLGLLARSRAVYDPSGQLLRLQRTLSQLTPADWAVYRAELTGQAGERLELAEARLRGGNTLAAQLVVLAQVRRTAVEQLYPALLTRLQLWPHMGLRLPHQWRAQAGVAFPRAVHHLDALYGYGGEAEARRVLLASRGFGLTEQEKRARLAIQAGYYDGAVRFLRDEAAERWLADLENWTYLSSARRDKLATLLGAGVSPLGPVALALARELQDDVQAGR